MTVYNKNNFEFMEHFLRIRIPFKQGYENDYIELDKKSSEKSREKSSEKILKLILNNSNITMSEIADNIGISVKAVEKQISRLKKIIN